MDFTVQTVFQPFFLSSHILVLQSIYTYIFCVGLRWDLWNNSPGL